MTDNDLLAEARAIVLALQLLHRGGPAPIYTYIAEYYPHYRHKEKGTGYLDGDGVILHALVMAYRHRHASLTKETLDEARSETRGRTTSG